MISIKIQRNNFDKSIRTNFGRQVLLKFLYQRRNQLGDRQERDHRRSIIRSIFFCIEKFIVKKTLVMLILMSVKHYFVSRFGKILSYRDPLSDNGSANIQCKNYHAHC